MGLKNTSLLSSTAVTFTGGTPADLKEDGVSIPNGLHLMVPADAFDARRQVTVKNRPPTLDAKTGVYGKGKQSICIAAPMTLSSGKVVFNTIRIEREIHPSWTAGLDAELNKYGAQVLCGDDFVDFWATGSLS